MRKHWIHVLAPLAILVVLFVAPALQPPAGAQFFGGGGTQYVLNEPIVGDSAAFDAAIGVDTIADLTEAGFLNSILLDTEGTAVSGVPEIDLVITVDGTAKSLVVYDGAITYKRWLDQYQESAGTGAGVVLLQVNTPYASSLKVEVDRRVAGTSDTTLNVIVVRSTVP